MSRAIRIGIIVAAAPLAVAIWASVVFAMDRASNGGEVLGGVTVGGIELTGMTEGQARRAIRGLEAEMAQTPIVFDVQGTIFQLLPAELGFDLDDEALLAEAMGNGRRGGIGGQFRWWLGHLGNRGRATVSLAGTWDPAALEPYLQAWEDSAIDDPPFEGGIVVRDLQVIPENPRPGTGIDVDATKALVEAVILDLEREVVVVPTTTVSPTLSLGEVGTAVARAQTLIAGPVVLSRLNPAVQVRFDAAAVAAALRSEVVGPDDDPEIHIFLDTDSLVEYLEPRRAEIEFPPVSAQVVIRPDDVPTVIPGRSGMLIDEDKLASSVQAAALSSTRSGVFPYREGEEPELTTQEAEDLGIKELITYHDGDVCCTTFYTPGGDERNQNRIHNIHLIADTVNGAIVMPGATFSLNEYVGQRTFEKGYRLAGAIIGDIVDCCDDPANIGGGVSQFTTTLYNAVFWSGLEDVEHTPHTLYISRYPEGIEATLGWPDPDLVFRNNTDAAVYIKTEHTADSVTVKFFGDNGGIKVEMARSERRDFTTPGDHYDADESVKPGDEKITTEGFAGFTVTVTRYITYPDGTKTTENWIWRYYPWPKRISVHPCDLPEDHEDYEPLCPSVVPDLLGVSLARATEMLQARNLVLVRGDDMTISDPALANKVVSQDPGPDTMLEAGSTVTVRIGALAQDNGGGG